MKTYRFLQIAGLVALMGATAGCADDALVQNAEQPNAAKGKPVTIQASVAEDGSRIAYQEGTTKMTMTWEADDVLKVLSTSGNTLITDFSLTSGEGKTFGTFSGTPEVAYANGEKLYAFYHNGMVKSQLNADGNVVLSLNEQDGTLNNDYQFMFGATAYEEGTGMQTVELKSLVSILKLTIQTDKTLTKVSLNSGDFRNKATLVLNNPSNSHYNTFQTGDLVYCYADDNEEDSNEVTVTGTFVPENGVVTVYFYILPAKRYWVDQDGLETKYVTPYFTAYDEEGNKYINTTPFANKQLSTEKMYRMNSGLFMEEDFANEATSNGYEDNPYEIANANQLYTFMYRSMQDRYGKDGHNYSFSNYKLTADIELNNEHVWVPTNLNYATFDGGGHTISGNILMKDVWQSGFFSSTNGAVIRDLTLAFSNVSFESDEHHDWFGTLVGSANGGTQIINCANHSNVTGDFAQMGGLVGYLLNSTMMGCVNTGNIASTGYTAAMGGLAAADESSSLIEACYNTGKLQATYPNMNVGGIIGTLKGAVKYCWSNSSLTHSDSTSENLYVGGIVGQSYGDLEYCYWNVAIAALYGDDEVGSSTLACGSFSTDTPDSEQIAQLNQMMELAGSDYRYDENGQFINSSVSEGNTTGSNFGNGGEF